MNRNYLKGTDGDKMNAILASCGFNLRKFLRALLWLVFKELERLKRLLWPFESAGLTYDVQVGGLRNNLQLRLSTP